ncbi:MAG: NAD(+) synthase, partial [Kiritimatiellaeota bacterium]|nr:NAD(+) synthase [Kiritimatiellota bacterium]
MRDYTQETRQRVEFIRDALNSAGAAGIVFGNSGGKDSALVGILCKMACEDTLGVIMPCGTQRNYGADKADAEALAAQYGVATRVIDLSGVKDALARSVGEAAAPSAAALANIAPRLRMTALYTVAASENRLVARTGNPTGGSMGHLPK